MPSPCSMAWTIPHLDETFTLLKQELRKYGPPIVSRSKPDIPDTPFVTLISCLLSLRTKDEVTEEATRRLLKDYHTPQQLSIMPIQKIEKLIYPVGFYKTKAHRIKEISRTLLE